MKNKKEIIKKIIEWSHENCGGTLLNESAISLLLSKIPVVYDRDKIDELLDEYHTECGFLVKASDIDNAIQMLQK